MVPTLADSRTRRPGWECWVATFALAFSTAVLRADEPATVRPASEARDHIGKSGTFEMVVRLTKDYEPRMVYYLDSEADYRDEKNLAVLIGYEDAAKFRKAGVDDPAKFYRGKTIRVTGKVLREGEQVRIRATEPAQIQVIAAPKPSTEAPKP